MSDPQPPPKRVPHTVRSSASSFNYQYPLFPLRSSSSCLRLLPRLPVTPFLPSIFPSIMCFRRQFLRKMWQNQLVVPLFIVSAGYTGHLIQSSSVSMRDTPLSFPRFDYSNNIWWAAEPIQFVSMFSLTRMWKAMVCFIMSVRPSVRPPARPPAMSRENTTRCVLREVSYLRLVIKFVDGFRFCSKYGRNIKHFRIRGSVLCKLRAEA
jgi:hypothetical protein